MDVVAESRSVVREVDIAAAPETVWELLVDPEQAIRWMGMSVTFDLRRGGGYRAEIVPGHTACGKYLEIDRPRKLAYTWGWEGSDLVPPGSTTVTFELLPRGDGTLLRLTHGGLPNADSVASHSHGWQHYMERLTLVAAGGNPGVDPWIAEQGKK